MTSEEELQKKRFIELADRSYQNGSYEFTGFLNENEISLFFELERELSYAGYQLEGGYAGADRRVLRFGNSEELGYEEPFPICCLKVEPLIQKFSDTFTHRDFLGAIMNLGVERSNIGDIVLRDNCAYVFVLDKMADYLMEQLNQVKHTHVSVKRFEETLTEFEKSRSIEEIQCSSERLDGVIAKVYRLSRNESLQLFRSQKIFVNGRQMENNSYLPKENDTISVRGYGKFNFCKVTGVTKKGKQNIRIERFTN